MLSWSQRRKITFSAILLFCFGAAAILFFFAFLYQKPSCSDGKRNQNELGVDCGGPCSRLCGIQTSSPIVDWARVFRVREGIYNVLAYVENPNFPAVVESAPYIFKLYDENNILVYEVRGSVFIPAKKVFGVFESGIYVGSRHPTRVFFEFTEDLTWEASQFIEPKLSLLGQFVSDEQIAPRIEAELKNETVFPISNIEATVIVYDKQENAITSSETQIERLEAGDIYPLVFTWPEPFSSDVGRIEILYNTLQ